jgi:hypothetical protein
MQNIILSPVIVDSTRPMVYAYDHDARNYFVLAEALGGNFTSGGYTETTTKVAISRWFTATKDFGIYDKIIESYLLVGVTYAGLLAKMKHAGTPTLTSVNFVSGDYIQAGAGAGLAGNANNKRLETSLSTQSVASLNHCISAYTTVAPSFGTGRPVVAALDGSTAAGFISNSVPNTNGTVGGSAPVFANSTGFFLMSNRVLFSRGVKGLTANAGPAFGNSTYGIFGRTVSHSSPRMTFVSIGTGLTDDEAVNLSTATNTLMTSLGANVY